MTIITSHYDPTERLLLEDITQDDDDALHDCEMYWHGILEQSQHCRTATALLLYNVAVTILQEIAAEWKRRDDDG